MKIVQVLETLSFGDAVSNDAVAMKDVIASMGYETELYAVDIHPKCTSMCKPYSKFPSMQPDDILIFHNSIGSDLCFALDKLPCRKIMVYHNVTPPAFFAPYQPLTTTVLEYGLEGTRYLSDKMDYCLAVSEFNKRDLQQMGYTCPIDVLPIIIPFDDYKKAPSKRVLQRYHDGRHNVVFTGRVAPNKRHEDIIQAFDCYQKLFDPKARLFLVGSYGEGDPYYLRLKAYCEKLKVRNVLFTGHIPFDEILAYYHLADLFVCMSEHEGFCVPLVEAMFFQVPVLAYDSTAIPSTLGGAGLLLQEKDPVLWAACMDRVLRDQQLQKQLVDGQNLRLQDLQYKRIKEQFVAYLQAFIQQGAGKEEA